LANPISPPPTSVQLNVEVIGADLFGMQFFEPAEIITIYRSGLTVLLENDLAPDTEVIVRSSKNNTEAVVLVLGRIRKEKQGHVYALAFVAPATDPLKLQLPDTGSKRTVTLECSECNHSATFEISEIESEILTATRTLTRPCKDCGSPKKWREPRPQVADSRSSRSSSRGAAKPGEGAAQSSSPKDRRKDRRMNMKVTACIRFSGQEYEVDCDDISKGGFRFTCSRKFPEGTRVETAVPFTKNSTNIFSTATIVRCLEMPDGQFQHGVAHFRRGSGPIEIER
jgi:hypothetical protein